ncbi:MAG: hypothetical protein CVT94_14435 [Bacteroidetes bacterium HGW-Bacteroidetes-11]|jgi:Na+/citrate or Na+/malate symporter|nr:MAG: hypothetical protein CVT94_14435 [Bacteroidetes bacterium HGW-Bacteroidetes-11]
MASKRRNILKVGAILLLAGLLTAGGIMYFMFHMPHRNVGITSADFSLTAAQLVAEYIENPASANEKYLSADGDSKVLAITGAIADITEDYNNQKVVLLKAEGDKAGVSCVFTAETNGQVINLSPGETITIKGVIRAGASYDEDLDMYLNAVIEKSSVLTTQTN